MERGKKDFFENGWRTNPQHQRGDGGRLVLGSRVCVQPAHGRCPSVRCKVRRAEVGEGAIPNPAPSLPGSQCSDPVGLPKVMFHPAIVPHLLYSSQNPYLPASPSGLPASRALGMLFPLLGKPFLYISAQLTPTRAPTMCRHTSRHRECGREPDRLLLSPGICHATWGNDTHYKHR